MHINRDVGTSAAAITVGLGQLCDTHPIRSWKEAMDIGWVDLYTEIGELAALSNELADKIANCVEFHNDGFAGVYAYEVDEAIGASLVELLAGTDEPMTGPKVKAKLGELALAFFKQVYKPIPITREIIKVMTGYVEPGYGEPNEVTLRMTVDVTYTLTGSSVQTMKEHLENEAKSLHADDRLTPNLAADLKEWTTKVEIIATE